MRKKGYECLECKCSLHESCLSINVKKCFGKTNCSHEFRETTFKTPMHCGKCGKTIFGIYKQGLECESNSCVI